MPDDQTLWALRDGLARETAVPFTVGGGQVLAASAKRIGIVVYPPAVDAIVVSFLTPVDLNSGCRVVAGGPPLVLSLETVGALVNRPLFGRTTGAGPQNIGIVEVGNRQ
jgi:hypothetical protein